MKNHIIPKTSYKPFIIKPNFLDQKNKIKTNFINAEVEESN
jgi:hypothetical protein